MFQSLSDDHSGARLLCAGSGTIFVAVLALALFAGLFIQLVLLPLIIPSLHAGHGLLRGADWVGFHDNAVKLADEIERLGWTNFELRPAGQAPVGIATMVYAITGIKEPWILIPLHAAVFGLGAVGLLNVYRRIFDTRLAALAVTPFVLFPSSVLLYAQIHKDVWSITGSIWIFYVLIAYASMQGISLIQHLRLLGITILAAIAVWLVRAYLLQLLLVGLFAAVGFLAVWTAVITRFTQFRLEASRWIGIVLCSLVVFAVALDWPAKVLRTAYPELAIFLAPPNVLEGVRSVSTPTIVPLELLKTLTPYQQELLAKGRLGELEKSLSATQLVDWQKEQQLVRGMVQALTPDKRRYWWMPLAIQERMETVIHIRRGYMLSGIVAAGSAIDHEAPIRNPREILHYVPRALQIGLFAPFPDMWFKSGVSPGAGVMRSVAGVETIVSYLLFAGFLPLLILANAEQWKRTMFVVLLVLPAICIFAITVPNVGTLYRTRFGFVHILMGFGIVGWGLAIYRLRRAGQRACTYIALSRGELQPPER